MNLLIKLIILTIIFYKTPLSSNEDIKSSVDNKYRSEENVKRDKYRNPIETLQFFGLNKKMKVLEITPGRGWYTEILSHYMRNTNNFYVATYKEPPFAVEIITKIQKEFYDYFDINKDKFGDFNTIYIDKNFNFEEKESYFDMILTFRNTHNFLSHKKSENILNSIHKALKKGGILGVVQHRADESLNINFEKGYVKESFLIDHIQNQGFELIGKSNINENPKDLKNYSKGVWSLPPRYANGEKDKDYYRSIGESDRMTIKFRKK